MSRDVAHETIVNEIIAALAAPLGRAASQPETIEAAP
jgi:hypothetical protein